VVDGYCTSFGTGVVAIVVNWEESMIGINSLSLSHGGQSIDDAFPC